MKPSASIREDGAVLVRATKCLLVLEPLEIACAVFAQPTIARRAIARGKAHRRAENTAHREGEAS